MQKIWQRILCLFGRHAAPEYCGEISIKDIDRNLHRIEYGNVMRCPVCRAKLKIDFS